MSSLTLQRQWLDDAVFNKKVAGHSGQYHGKQMASILLPLRAGEAKQILLSDRSYIRRGDHPPPPQSANLHQTVNTSVLSGRNTGGARS
jgi:hypothetical protein